MKVAVCYALKERNVYNRRCQPPESKRINNVKPQRGVTVTPRWGFGSGRCLYPPIDTGGYRHFATFGARKLQLPCYTLKSWDVF